MAGWLFGQVNLFDPSREPGEKDPYSILATGRILVLLPDPFATQGAAHRVRETARLAFSHERSSFPIPRFSLDCNSGCYHGGCPILNAPPDIRF